MGEAGSVRLEKRKLNGQGDRAGDLCARTWMTGSLIQERSESDQLESGMSGRQHRTGRAQSREAK